MIIKLFLFLILIQVFSNNLFPQRSDDRFLDLQGIEDSSDDTFLFYRIYYNYDYGTQGGRADIYKFNVSTFGQALLYSDYWWVDGMNGESRSVLDYVFYNQSEVQGLSCGDRWSWGYYSYAFITKGGIVHQWPGNYYPRITNLEISKQNNNKLYAAVEVGYSNYTIFNSIDGGYSWDTLSLGNYILKSISSLNDSLFLSSSIQGDLYKSSNAGIDYHLVDDNNLIDWKIEWYGNFYPGGQFKFLYDTDNQHIYTVANNSNLDKYYLVISEDLGESWQIKDSSSTPIPIYIDIDNSQSGSIYKCAGTTIYKSTDYGESFNVYKEIASPTIIRGIYKKPATDLLYIITQNVLYEVTSSSVTPILIISEHPMNILFPKTTQTRLILAQQLNTNYRRLDL